MKFAQAVIAAILLFTFVPSAKAEDLCTHRDGTSVVMYLRQNPRTDIGPGYSCQEVSRVRTCVNGVLSEEVPECTNLDSGACHAWWIELLADSDFKFPTCAD